jgi:L-2-hydroxyglutarate oxidase LhgO
MRFDSIVIGAGIIGLATARRLALAGKKVLVLEANAEVGKETSFRNSAVIHAGIYYEADTLKAELCAQGAAELYKYCDEKKVPYKKIGKLIIATEEAQLPEITKLYERAQRNGVKDARIISAEEVFELEPAVKSVGGLYSPSTGVVNGKELMMSLKCDIEKAGSVILCNKKVVSVTSDQGLFVVKTADGGELFESTELVNSAGLSAQAVARTIAAMPPEKVPGTYYAKGNYFKFFGSKPPFTHLVYPIPEKAGLGIHATIDLEGAVRFGPDVEWVEELDFSVNPDRKILFLNAIKSYYPGITAEDLRPEFAGIRPKYKPKEEQPQDFYIQSAADHSVSGLVNLFGMESPGLTCSLVIAEHVFKLLKQPHPVSDRKFRG